MKKFAITFILLIGFSFLSEAIIFSSLPGAIRLYPLVENYPPTLWIMKHFLITIGLFFILYVIERRFEWASSWKAFTVGLFLFLGFVVASLEQIGYKGVAFCGPNCESIAAPISMFIFAMFFAITNGFVLFSILKTQKGIYPRASRVFLLGSLIIIFFSAGHPIYQYLLSKQIPLNEYALRQSEKLQHFGSSGFATSIYAKSFLLKYSNISKKISKEQWMNICSGYRISSLNFDLYGRTAADSCFYLGGIVYKDNLFCFKAGDQKTACFTDLAQLTKNISLCADNKTCFDTNIELTVNCEPLKTAKDIALPAYIPEELSLYSKCLYDREKIGRSARSVGATNSDDVLVALFHKISIQDCEVEEFKGGPFLVLKNNSNDIISSENLILNFGRDYIGKLPLQTIRPGLTRVNLRFISEKLKTILTKETPKYKYFNLYYKNWAIGSCDKRFK